MSIIKNHLQVELSIDQILYRLRLLRLNELPNKKLLVANSNMTKHHHNRPPLETRSTSPLNMRNPCMSPIEENDEVTPRKRTEMIDSITDTLLNIPEPFIVQSSQSTPMIVALSDQIQLVHGTKKNTNNNSNNNNKKQQEKELRRERNQTKRGLLMTKPE